MVYEADIKLIDRDSPEVHRIKGRADKALAQAINYIKEKDGKGVLRKIVDSINKDFEFW